MIQYIYFVKCPDLEDEPFDFFDDAKGYALGCLGNKPIITQVEVDRNDFGECTDSNDLGTIWSWEDEVNVTEDDPAASVFTQGDFAEYNPDHDTEFATLDNSLDDIPDNFRKPIPDNMTLKELVEEMEENEDTVECTWCNELFDKSECRYEVDLGYLCHSCEAAIKSRGETLTFRENNYWDFLDESVKPLTWVCLFNDKEVGTVTAVTEEEALEKMQTEYPELPYGDCDGCFSVYISESLDEVKTEEQDEYPNKDTDMAPTKDLLEELEDSDVYRSRLTMCPECGENEFDPDTGICGNCGFNIL
jgi:hypothetical protein